MMTPGGARASARKDAPAAAPAAAAPTAAAPQARLSSGFGLRAEGACPCGGGCPSCASQPAAPAAVQSLRLSDPADHWELEAERIADNLAGRTGLDPGGSPRLGELAPVGLMDAGPLRTVGPAAFGPGMPLPDSVRSELEPRLGSDFSAVRTHTGPSADASARDLGAMAYTVGRDIVFAAGTYAPQTSAGRRLLAHELAHVVQHDRTGISRCFRFEAPGHERTERAGLTQGPGALTNEEASAVYFGNWMRDMNQVFVPLVSSLLPNDVIFGLLSYTAVRKFARELTPAQFGYYIPAEHIDNPGGLVARDDLLASPPPVPSEAMPTAPGRLGPIRPAGLDTPQEAVEPGTGRVRGVSIFDVDQTGVMAHIRRTNEHVERRLQLAADGGRTPEGMQNFGAALHAIEDLFAHSNFVEIAVDRLLKTDRTFLPAMTGNRRRVFRYAPDVRIGRTRRPVLTTGTFTAADTQVSIASEVAGLLTAPLPDPATNAEREAQDRFVISLLRTFQARLQNNPTLQAAVRRALVQAGAPQFVANQAHNVPITEIYRASTILSIPIPDSIRIPLKREIREIVSQQVLRPLAGSLQAMALEARISDTSLIQVQRDSQRVAAGQFTSDEVETQQFREQLTGTAVPQIQQEARAAAGRRVAAIQAAPLATVAGPSHSQISKDHPNSPFFGIAFRLAYEAVSRMMARMLVVWNQGATGGISMPFNFEWQSFPGRPPAGLRPADADAYNAARDLYHADRNGRTTRDLQSLTLGAAIVSTGGADAQSFDLAAQRQQAADRVHAVAAALRAMAGSPGASARAIAVARGWMSQMVPQIEQRLTRQLAAASAAARGAAGSQTVAILDTVATDLDNAAALIGAARFYDERANANRALVTQRSALLNSLATRPGTDQQVAAALLYTLDQEIQSTAVAFTAEQRALLEGHAPTAPGASSARPLTVSTVTLATPSGTAAMIALINESRLLLGHPYENNWWQPILRDYATRFPTHLLNDIEARNEGVTLYREGP